MPELKKCRLRRSLTSIMVLLCPSVVEARAEPSTLCRSAAADASAQTGVPYDVLLAITMVETGRGDQPWPWTVNFGGAGQWFDDKAQAAANVDAAIREGQTNIDLGCFQLNYRWHSQGFSSALDMLDPIQNATYAARYLAEQYAKTGDWALAAAAYHSATPEHAAVYKEKFEIAFSRLAQEDPSPAAEPLVVRQNSFPLLIATAPGQNGSLFSASKGGRPLIGAP